MLPDLNRLRVFFHIYTTEGVGAAAERLHVTQSAVSQSLRKLESELETQLFVRTRNRLVATSAARALFDVVAPFLANLERGVVGIHRARQELVGTLRIGAPTELGIHRMPSLLAAFRAQHHEVCFELRLGHPSSIIPMLERGELDIVLADMFTSRQSQQVGLSVEKLVDEHLVLVGSKKYLTTLGRIDTAEDLLAASYIAYRPRAPALHSWFAHHFKKSALRLDIALTVESVQAVIGAIEHHMGLGVVPSHFVKAQPARRRLVEVPTRRKPLTNRVSLVRLLDRVPNALEKTVTGYIRQQLRA